MLNALRRVFSLDTLDGVERSATVATASSLVAVSPRIKRIEMTIWTLALMTLVPWMVYTAYTTSQESNPNYASIEPLLEPGWIFGRKVDNSDAQYSNVRDNLAYLILVAALHVLGRKCAGGSRRPYDLVANSVLLVVLHGASSLKLLFILLVNYAIAIGWRGRLASPVATWVFNIALLFVNEYFDGYRYSCLLPGRVGMCLDGFTGLLERWQIHYKISMLRMISFNMDAHHAATQMKAATDDDKAKSAGGMSSRERQQINQPADAYSIANMYAYVFYCPLYLAGPIVTFNDWMVQQNHPVAISRSQIRRYAIRFAVSFLTMETLLHFVYVVAISKTKAWEGDTPFQICMIGYFNLHIIWLKLLIPWRYFRLWAMIDGIETPENMIRCMSNNYSPLSFWRSWHRSLNRWIIRYIYIPLGGSKRPLVNMLVVFTFVAIWHDIHLRLLMWGWLVVLFVLPEVIGKALLPAKRYGGSLWYRYVSASGAVVNIVMMMLANLVGFAVGVDGLRDMLSSIFSSFHDALLAILMIYFTLMQGVLIMFHIREQEHLRGIDLRC